MKAPDIGSRSKKLTKTIKYLKVPFVWDSAVRYRLVKVGFFTWSVVVCLVSFWWPVHPKMVVFGCTSLQAIISTPRNPKGKMRDMWKHIHRTIQQRNLGKNNN